MAKQKNRVVRVGEQLLAGKRSRSHNLVSAWGDVPVVPPEVLREWIAEKTGEVQADRVVILKDAPKTHDLPADGKGAKTEEKLCAVEFLTLGNDYLDLAKQVAGLLDDEQPPVISIAFTAGLRLGIAYERLLSLSDGRSYEKWLRNEGRSAAGRGTKELGQDSEILLLRSTYAKYQGQVKAVEKTANELFERHGIKGKRGTKISARTVRNRLKELKILDNA